MAEHKHPYLWRVVFVWVDAHVPAPTRDEILAAVTVAQGGDPEFVLDLFRPTHDGRGWLCRLGWDDAVEVALIGYIEIPLGTIVAQVELP